MSIIETFYILFKTDSTDLDKGVKHVNDSVKRLGASLVNLAAAGISFAAAIHGIKSAISYGAELNQASQALSVNTEALDMWDNAVRKTGGSAQAFQSSLKNLSERFGITGDQVLKLLPRIADQLHRLNTMQALRYGKMIGLDEGTILLLQQGSRELDQVLKRQKELGLITKNDAMVFGKFRYELGNTEQAMRSIFSEIAVAVIPIITKVMIAFEEMAMFIHRHSNVIKGALIPVAIVMGIIAGEFAIANAGVLLVVGGFLALSAAVGLAYDDIVTFMNGGDSLIGRAIKRWPILTFIFKDMKAAISTLIQSLEIVGNLLIKIFGFFGGKAKDLFMSLKIGQDALNSAGNSQISPLTSNSIVNSNMQNRSTAVQTGPITINTQATDAKGVAYGLDNELQRQLRQTQNDIASGVMI